MKKHLEVGLFFLLYFCLYLNQVCVLCLSTPATGFNSKAFNQSDRGYLHSLLICLNTCACMHEKAFCLQPCNPTLEEESSAHKADFTQISFQAKRAPVAGPGPLVESLWMHEIHSAVFEGEVIAFIRCVPLHTLLCFSTLRPSWMWHSRAVSNLLRFIIEWLALEGASRIMKFQLPCRSQGCQPIDQVLNRAAQSPVYPGIECFQGWGNCNFSGQPVPAPHHHLL